MIGRAPGPLRGDIVLRDVTEEDLPIFFDGSVAGHVSSFESSGKRELSYWIGKRYWGRGVSTRALSRFLGQVELCPLNARAAKDNTASIRVLEKCGFAIRGEDEGFSNARGVEVEEFILELQANAGSSPRFERSVEMSKEDAVVFVGPEGGKALVNPIGGRMVAKLSDEDTGGAYSIHDNTIPPGSSGPRPHVHRHHEEAFYVLEGELTVRVGARRITAPAGSFVVLPRGAVHQPSNPGTEPTRVLLIFSPAGMKRFFEEAAEGRMPLQAEPEDPAVRERLAAFTERYGYEFAELTPS